MEYKTDKKKMSIIAESLPDAYQLGKIFNEYGCTKYDIFLDFGSGGVRIDVDYEELLKMLLVRSDN